MHDTSSVQIYGIHGRKRWRWRQLHSDCAGQSADKGTRFIPHSLLCGKRERHESAGKALTDFSMTLFTWSQATFRRFRLSIPPRFTLQILRLTRDISWIGDGPPIAEPHCGYHGEKCTCTCVFTILLLLLLPSFFILSLSFNFIRLAIKINQFRDNFLFFFVLCFYVYNREDGGERGESKNLFKKRVSRNANVGNVECSPDDRNGDSIRWGCGSGSSFPLPLPPTPFELPFHTSFHLWDVDISYKRRPDLVTRIQNKVCLCGDVKKKFTYVNMFEENALLPILRIPFSFPLIEIEYHVSRPRNRDYVLCNKRQPPRSWPI